MLVDSDALWDASTNTYVVAADRDGPAVVIDAPPDPQSVIDLLARHGLAPVAMLISHGHVDHVGGAAAVTEQTGAVAYLHPDDDFLSLHPEAQLRMLYGRADPSITPPTVYERLEDGQTLRFAGVEFEVLHTPGHTPGHCCFHVRDEGVLFSGDQLFAGSVGRWDLPGGDFTALMNSMATKVLTLPDDTAVLPGHGPSTTISAERRSNPFLQDLM